MPSMLDGFLGFAKEFYEFDAEEVFNGPDTMEGVRNLADVYSLYTAECAIAFVKDKFNRDVKIDRVVLIDFQENKYNRVHYMTRHSIGGRESYVLACTDDFTYGKIAEDMQDFDNNLVATVQAIAKVYLHNEHYIDPKPDGKFYNVGRSMVLDKSSLDRYFKP